MIATAKELFDRFVELFYANAEGGPSPRTMNEIRDRFHRDGHSNYENEAEEWLQSLDMQDPWLWDEEEV